MIKKKKLRTTQKSQPCISQLAYVKTFQAKQLCILCRWKNDENAVAHSILLALKSKGQGPLKIQKKSTYFSELFWSKQNWANYGVFVKTCAQTLLGPSTICTLRVLELSPQRLNFRRQAWIWRWTLDDVKPYQSGGYTRGGVKGYLRGGWGGGMARVV